ncbi:type II secretion system protein, partial [bacterium]|nr:type II secretion system protein [bacterium]
MSKSVKTRPFQRRGVSLTELMVSLSIFGFILAGATAIFLLSTRTIKEIYGPTRSRAARMAALNQIRFRLCDARIGSCVFFPDEDNRRLRYVDPSLPGTPTSEFYFDSDPDNPQLYYDEN